MYNSQNLVDKIRKTAKSKNILIKTMLDSCGLNVNTLSQVSNKKGLSSFSLAKIADYLDCSVDYLLGRTSNSSSITMQKKSSPSELTESEQKMIDIFKCLSPMQQGEIIGRAQHMAEQNEKIYTQEDIG